MKLKTDYTVTISPDEAAKILTKFIEKKTGKKVVDANHADDGSNSFTFKLQGEEADLDKESV